nr:MAG TPA: hypothetical protein [Bacteriophage sp.]
MLINDLTLSVRSSLQRVNGRPRKSFKMERVAGIIGVISAT